MVLPFITWMRGYQGRSKQMRSAGTQGQGGAAESTEGIAAPGAFTKRPMPGEEELGSLPRYGRRKGRRGLALGSVDTPEKVRQAYDTRESAPGKRIQTSEIEEFLHHGLLVFVNSSNVAAAQYFPGQQALMIEYLDGAAWMYDPIDEPMAEQFMLAPSKGTWVWDHIKVRGTVHQHQCNARRLR